MTSPFKAKKGFDCRAKDLFDTLTFLHDLGLWDELTYEFAEDPIGLIEHINTNGDDFLKEWEQKNLNWAICLESFGNKKIQLIKVIRNFCDIGLADAKRISESLPIVCPWVYKTRAEAENSAFFKMLSEFEGFMFSITRLNPSLSKLCVKGEHARVPVDGIRGPGYAAINYNLFNEINHGKLKSKI